MNLLKIENKLLILERFLSMNNIHQLSSSSSSSYYSFGCLYMDKSEEKKDVTHLDRSVSSSSNDECFFTDNQSSSEYVKKSIDELKVNPLKSNDSGQCSISEDLKCTKKIGQGGFSEVWLAESIEGVDKYAFKVPFRVKYLEAESEKIEKIEKIGEHPNIIKLFGIVDVDDNKGILMEYIPGNDLSKLLPELTERYLQGIISHSNFWGTIQFIVKEILSGISCLEQQGYAHQDIKPQNIVIHEKN